MVLSIFRVSRRSLWSVGVIMAPCPDQLVQLLPRTFKHRPGISVTVESEIWRQFSQRNTPVHEITDSLKGGLCRKVVGIVAHHSERY